MRRRRKARDGEAERKKRKRTAKKRRGGRGSTRRVAKRRPSRGVKKGEKTAKKKTTSSRRPKAKFKPGQMIVYPFHGVGRVVGFEEHLFDGEKHWYYVIDFRDGELTVRFPVSRESEVAIRPVISRREAKKVIEVLARKKGKEEADWKARFAEYNEKLKTGDIYAAAEVLRNLTKRGPEGELSMSEKRLLDASHQLVIHELAVAEKRPIEEVEAEVYSLLRPQGKGSKGE